MRYPHNHIRADMPVHYPSVITRPVETSCTQGVILFGLVGTTTYATTHIVIPSVSH
jgi:hypothetical protein